MPMSENKEFNIFLSRLEKLSDEHRQEAALKRHESGNRTARENLKHLIDEDSFIEFGAFAVAAQRSRKEYDALQIETSADGVITGFQKHAHRDEPEEEVELEGQEPINPEEAKAQLAATKPPSPKDKDPLEY